MSEINKNQSFSMLPNDLATEYGYTVAGIYARMLNECEPPDYTFSMPQNLLAKKFGVSERNFRTVLKKLEDIKIVEQIHTAGGTTVYKVIPIVNARVHQKSDSEGDIRKVYGHYGHVRLSAHEYAELVKEFDEQKIKNYIRNIDEWCEQNEKTFPNYEATIRKWIREDKETKIEKRKSKKKKYGSSMSPEELESYLSLGMRFIEDDEK